LQPDAISEVKLGQCTTLDIVALALNDGGKEQFTRQTKTVQFFNLMQFQMLICTGYAFRHCCKACISLKWWGKEQFT